jgi:hypothetical protein
VFVVAALLGGLGRHAAHMQQHQQHQCVLFLVAAVK